MGQARFISKGNLRVRQTVESHTLRRIGAIDSIMGDNTVAISQRSSVTSLSNARNDSIYPKNLWVFKLRGLVVKADGPSLLEQI
jgi:hypothetical protein